MPVTRRHPQSVALGALVLVAGLVAALGQTAPSSAAARGPLPASARAAQPAADAPSAAVLPAAARPGRRVVVTGAGFTAAETVRVELGNAAGSSTKAVSVADPAGRVRAAFRVPLLTAAGSWTVSVVGSTSGVSASAGLLIRTNWSQFGRGRAHHADNPYERLVARSNAGSLTPAWRTGTVTGCTSYSSPTVVARQVYVGDYCGAVSALEAATGARLWTVSTDGKVDSTPAVVGSRVLVATGVPGHSVYALSRTDGHVLWRYEMASGVLASPVVRNGVVYQASTDGWVYALDAIRGTLVWKAQMTKLDGDLASTPVVGDDALYVGSNDGHLDALSLRDGSLLWAGDVGSPVRLGSPVLTQHGVLVSSEVGLFDFPQQGCGAGVSVCAPTWRSEDESALTDSLAVADGLVYAVGENGVVRPYRAGCKGQVCDSLGWYEIPFDQVSAGVPSIAGRVLYVTSSFPNAVTAFGINSHSPLWTYDEGTTDYPGSPGVTVVDGTVFATLTWSRAFVAFRPTDPVATTRQR